MQRINGHFVNTDGTQTQVKITDGTYRNEAVQGTFLLVRDLKEGARGSYITVQMIPGGDRLPSLPDDIDENRVFRVKVDANGYGLVDAQEPAGAQLILATDYCQQQGLKYDSFRKTKIFQAMKVKGEDGRLYVQA